MTTTTNITTLDELSSEIVLSIFDFLSPVDRYNAFFYSNSRLRSLVKRWTQYSRKGLDADICRFSTLHSWYKHLHFENGGTLYFIWPQKGQQPRYRFDPRVTDALGLHWHFIYYEHIESIVDERVRAIIARHPFRLNPFFYHQERQHSPSTKKSSRPRAFYGGDIILSSYSSCLKSWLESNYPDYAEIILNRKNSNNRYGDDYDEGTVPIFDGEWSKAMSAIREAADQVWSELRDLDDVNPLNLELA
ncbi:unnamed protein product [Rotaria sp. Silwood2]|nr:unnamed protein product [Rotaria sp. Silwood2]CAF4579368.1 unnamed protein product [Rotaria sp. Silwood2]